jgi:hypothetical protein
MSNDFKPHLFLKKVHTTQNFTTTQKGGPSTIIFPQRDRVQHGEFLLSALTDIWEFHNKEITERKEIGLPVKNGEYISFTSAVNDNLQLSSLDANGAKLLNVKSDKETQQQIATVFIPENKKEGLLKKVEEYLSQNAIYKGVDQQKPKNQPLVDTIENISVSTIENIWSSPIEFLPREQQIWCELWLDTEVANPDHYLQQLKSICTIFDIELIKNYISFPQRIIAVVRANYAQLSELIRSFPLIAEIRKTEELNSFWLSQITVEREDWIQDALSKINFTATNNYVTILDTGINNGHLLISPLLSDFNRLTVDSAWGINDMSGHGTRMAGVVAYGNLNSILENNGKTNINHLLESVKILPQNGNQPHQYPFITLDAVNTAVINNPDFKRIYCLAVTSEFQNDFGKPSTWSAVIDSIIFGADENDKKLFVISIGNVRDEEDWKNYPNSNLDLAVESPAQSWNAISVGAYTLKTLADRQTVANHAELSPFSRTSSSWENSWPIKPDVVFEGGNLESLNNGDVSQEDDLEILTTSNISITNNFSTINATSAATATASHFLAKLRDIYPEAWPETLRGLMIHSASWTEEMFNQFGYDIAKKSSEALKLLRIYGYGVPNLEKAIQCKSNYLTFVSEQSIQPYVLDGGSIKTKDIHYYEFPWPKEVLQNLGAANTTLRVTLSYFIEPNPGDKGYSTKYSYQSTALKFLLINPGEDFDNFKLRTNRINQDDLKQLLGVPKLDSTDIERETGNDRWSLGADNVFKGSIHSNYWKGTAAEIASCNILAIYPVASGWWKQLKKQNKANSKLKYSLTVSIETPENTTDIYTTIANKLIVENLIKV